jgi:DNA gyrase subunit A
MLERAGAERPVARTTWSRGFGLIATATTGLRSRAPGAGHPRPALQRLTGLEQDKIIKEFEEILEKIADLLDILRSPTG